MNAIKFDKEEFLDSELGQDFCDCIEGWVSALVDLDNYEIGSYARHKVNVKLTWCYAQWLVYKKMLKDVFGVEYHFIDTNDYAGVCNENESDWLVKFRKTGGFIQWIIQKN